MAFNDTRNDTQSDDTQSNELNQETGSHPEPSTAQAQNDSNLNPNANGSELPKVGSTRNEKETMTEDFATALETFEQEQNELAANEDRVLTRYFSALSVFAIDKSRVINIDFTATDPLLAADADMTHLVVEKHKLRGADGRNATISIARIPHD